jgi:filamentous hemagglutinin family protein
MKRTTRQSFRKGIACLMAFLIVNGPVWAISSTDVVTSTNAGVSTSGNTTTVDVLGSRSVIDWSSFNTASVELLEFQRVGGANFAVLNRILSGSPTQFNGTLNGNQGHIIVINANGIVFGPTAEVTARRFTASTLPLDMSDADFLSGSDNFTFKTGSARGKIELAAGAEITAERIELLAHQIANSGVLVGTGDMVILATGDEIFLASESEDIVVKIAVPNTSKFTYTIANQTGGQIQNSTGKVVLAAGDTFAQAMSGIHNQAFSIGDYNIEQRGTIQAAELEAGAAQRIALRAGSSTEAGEINLAAQKIEIRQSLETAGDITADSDYHISVFADIKSGGDMSLAAHQSSIVLQGQAVSEGTMTMDAATDIIMLQGASSEDTMALTAGNRVIAYNTLSSQADMTIAANETLTNANITSVDDLTLNSPVILFGTADQTLESADGRVTAKGFIHKVTPGQLFITGNDPELSVDLQYAGMEWGVQNKGNIYISGQGDIQLSGDLTGISDGGIEAAGEGEYIWTVGGVSVISQDGRIYTEGSNALNVTINGFSSDIYYISEVTPYAGKTGVDLPYKTDEGDAQGKAAIVLQSKESLILGPDASLQASGLYLPASESSDAATGVDDRAGANFLAADAAIGGLDRNQGVPSDIAIYAGSTGGNVTIQTAQIGVQNYAAENATVVVDAYDTVSMPFLADLSPDSKFGGFRLEVSSRITEWLFQAVDGDKLPFAANPAFVEAILGNDYVLRGAGLDNPAITDGRAWVLEDPTPTPVPAPLPVLELPALKGCPVEMQAAAAELGIPAETLQMTFRNALAMNPNILPCDACARLVTAATILNDADGIRLAAMNQIFNTLAPADAPFTPEVSASVVTAFAQLGDQDKQYALAAEYVDAFVRYVAVLDKELKAPVGDAVAFTLEKHGAALTADNANPNIAAYILAQLMPEEM